jgi:hypothetical protein
LGKATDSHPAHPVSLQANQRLTRMRGRCYDLHGTALHCTARSKLHAPHLSSIKTRLWQPSCILRGTRPRDKFGGGFDKAGSAKISDLVLVDLGGLASHLFCHVKICPDGHEICHRASGVCKIYRVVHQKFCISHILLV